MDWGVLGGILEGLRGHLGVSWGVLGTSGGGLGRSWGGLSEHGATRQKKGRKRWGGTAPQGGGLGDPLDAKIDPRAKEIEEKTDEAGKLNISSWTRKTRVQMDLGGIME